MMKVKVVGSVVVPVVERRAGMGSRGDDGLLQNLLHLKTIVLLHKSTTLPTPLLHLKEWFVCAFNGVKKNKISQILLLKICGTAGKRASLSR